MEYTNLGRTGLKVSRLCLGTMNFGPQTTEPDSFAIMDRALEHGINFFDTANVYGWKLGEGSPSRSSAAGSPRAAAGATRSCWPPRSTARWATGPTTRACPPGTSSRPARTRCAGCRPTTSTSTRCTTSPGRTPWEEIWQAMEMLVAQGKVLYVGSSNFAGWHIAAGAGVGRGAPLPRPGLRAVHLQPAHPARRAGGDPGRAAATASASSRGRRCTAACSPARCASRPRAPAARSTRAGPPTALERAPRRRSRRTRSSAPSSARTRPTWRWPGCCPGRASPRRSSARARIEQLDGPLGALSIELDEATLARLDELFPPVGNGGPGPEAWAW